METAQEYWGRLVAEQQASGKTVRQFCREQGIGEHSFYVWRRRLRESRPVQFALIETKATSLIGPASASALELVLVSGDRLRIGNGVDPATLRVVLEALRG